MKYTENDYIEKCNELNLDYIGTSKHNHKGTMIHFKCMKHLDKGEQLVDWSHFRTYTIGCKYCSGRGKTTGEIQSKIYNKDVVLISEYKGNEKKIKCRCRKCNNVWETLPKILITNKSGCPKCGKKKAIKGETKKHIDFVNDLKVANNTLIVVGKYKNSKTNIRCKCKICGKYFSATPSNLLSGNTGCKHCNMSNSELKLLQILEKFGITYKSQHKIDGCIYVNNLKFDAFDIDNNVAFEYNGEQHYRPVDFAGRGNDWANQQLEINKKRDRAKKEYCDKNGIPLIIVPYWERDNMESFLIQEFKRRNLYVN